MLADRHYMRDQPYRSPMSMTVKLLIAFAAVFVIQAVGWSVQLPVEYWFALSNFGIAHGWLWQLVTYNFLHGGLFHILINSIVFYWLGKFAETTMGSRRLLSAFLFSGIAGGLLQGVLMLLMPDRYGGVAVGASAGVAGLLAIFALLQRNATINIYFILPVKAIIVLWVSLGIAVLFTLFPSGGNVAHAAHLGGLLAGMLWVKQGWHHSYVELPWEKLFSKIPRVRLGGSKSSRPSGPRKPGTVRRPVVNAKVVKETKSGDFISTEVDPILDKIAQHGIHSLTPREREILERAQKKMSGR